ncbi:MAG: DUF721 domain-containing protein [Alphaproteobacteria bacterium GM202ARS2]|nr:DUF721 domain-containing protein [Alphaproteobacteria bacterium GM202ARS2]
MVSLKTSRAQPQLRASRTPVSRGLQPLARSTQRLLAPLLPHFNPLESELRLNWSKIIGKHHARFSHPLKIVYHKPTQHTVLQLGVLTHASTEYQHDRARLTEMINTFFNQHVIDDIHILPRSNLPCSPET